MLAAISAVDPSSSITLPDCGVCRSLASLHSETESQSSLSANPEKRFRIINHGIIYSINLLILSSTDLGHSVYSRPGDIYHPDFLHGKPAYFDVSVRNSFHLAYTVKSAVQPGSAAEAGEIEKDSRHDSDVSSCGGQFCSL